MNNNSRPEPHLQQIIEVTDRLIFPAMSLLALWGIVQAAITIVNFYQFLNIH